GPSTLVCCFAKMVPYVLYSLLFFPISIMFSSPMSTTPVKINIY
ncbi:unnamed protein product, partial [Brassica rapa]